MKTWVMMVSCGLLLLGGCDSDDSGMSFDDLQQLDQSEQSELLALSEQAAKNWNFSSAEDYLAQAEEKGYAPDTIDHAKQVIRKQRVAYRKDQERKAEARRREEQRRLAEAQRQRRSSGSSGGSPDFVTVQGSCVAAGCGSDKLTLSGGSGNFSGNGSASSVTILKGYDGSLGGRYSYSIRINYRKYCSGSFQISGRNSYVLLNVYEDCHADISEH